MSMSLTCGITPNLLKQASNLFSSTSQLNIHLDNPTKPYFLPGEDVSGHVILVLTEPKHFKYISVKFVGTAKVEWFKYKRNRRGNRRKNYRDTYIYFRQKAYLKVGWGTEGDKLPIGTTTLPFSYILPPNLPSSYSASCSNGNGIITYEIIAKFKTPFLRSDVVKTIQFPVSGILDLNLNPRLNQKHSLDGSRCVYPLCFKSGPVTFRVEFPKVGFLPGEKVPFSLEIVNMTKANIIKSVLTLVKKTTLRTSNSKSCNYESAIIVMVEGPKVHHGDEHIENFPGHYLIIPHLASPTSLAGYCPLIEIQYVFEFEITIGEFLRNTLKKELPICIGTINFSVLQENNSINL